MSNIFTVFITAIFCCTPVFSGQIDTTIFQQQIEHQDEVERGKQSFGDLLASLWKARLKKLGAILESLTPDILTEQSGNRNALQGSSFGDLDPNMRIKENLLRHQEHKDWVETYGLSSLSLKELDQYAQDSSIVEHRQRDLLEDLPEETTHSNPKKPVTGIPANCIRQAPKGAFTYVGEMQNGLYHGEGTLTYPGQPTYVGTFENGQMHGHGVLTYPNGNTHTGEFRYGFKHGQGRFVMPGEVREGRWLHNFPAGILLVTRNNKTLEATFPLTREQAVERQNCIDDEKMFKKAHEEARKKELEAQRKRDSRLQTAAQERAGLLHQFFLERNQILTMDSISHREILSQATAAEHQLLIQQISGNPIWQRLTAESVELSKRAEISIWEHDAWNTLLRTDLGTEIKLFQNRERMTQHRNAAAEAERSRQVEERASRERAKAQRARQTKEQERMKREKYLREAQQSLLDGETAARELLSAKFKPGLLEIFRDLKRLEHNALQERRSQEKITDDLETNYENLEWTYRKAKEAYVKSIFEAIQRRIEEETQRSWERLLDTLESSPENTVTEEWVEELIAQFMNRASSSSRPTESGFRSIRFVWNHIFRRHTATAQGVSTFRREYHNLDSLQNLICLVLKQADLRRDQPDHRIAFSKAFRYPIGTLSDGSEAYKVRVVIELRQNEAVVVTAFPEE